jgi:tetratricopeptide (TPR) repeat protein
MRRLLWLLPVLLIVGCRSGTLPDPNDPRDVGQVPPSILSDNLLAVSEALLERRISREIDDREYRELLSQAARELVQELDLKLVDPAQAWEYAEVLRAARRWEEAKELLGLAVQHARLTKNEDRRLNDTLRMAHCAAELGQVDEAIELVRSVMDAKPIESAPILPAVFFEIVPAALQHGRRVELAELLEAAADKHSETVVDPNTPAGRDFLIARPFHMRNAYLQAAEIYLQNGRESDAQRVTELARQAQEQRESAPRPPAPGDATSSALM